MQKPYQIRQAEQARILKRKMLHFDKWSGVNEKFTKFAQKALADEFLAQTDRVVIIDDTNLGAGVMESWKQFAKERKVEMKIIKMDTPLQVCIERDNLRMDNVGREVIINMARKNGLYEWKQNDVIVDLDGTLADLTHRLHFVQETPKNWDGFFDAMMGDEPRKDVVKKVKKLAKDHNIVIVSARPERFKGDTQLWLMHHNIPYETLIMRPDGDARPDDEIKQQILLTYFDEKKIDLVIDDRPRVIRMWRANGLEVDDVGNGVEF